MIFNNFKYKKALINFFLFIPILSSTETFSQSNELTFEEEINIGNDSNFARTKDADTADINADGWPDILDANSNNIENETGLTIRFNNQGTGFNSQTITEGPDNVTSYDADLVDLNRDGYPDLIRTESVRSGGRSARIAVYRNLQGNGGTGRAWFDLRTPADSELENECPDDIAFGDLNNDGWTDFAVARRRFNCVTGANQSSGVSVYINTSADNANGDITFELTADLPATNTSASIHDVVILNASFDDRPEILALNEQGRNELYINRGGSRPSFDFSSQNLGSNSTTAAVGNLNLVPRSNTRDRNAKALDDLVLVDRFARTVTFHEQRRSAFGQWFIETPFQTVEVPEFSLIYDVELGDFNLDGFQDVLVNGFSNNSVPASLMLVRRPSSPFENNPAGDFVKLPITLFPNQPNDDYLSGDALDYDLDGDLDVYVAGGDGGRPNGCFGCVRNRFYENTVQTDAVYNNFENGLDGWRQTVNDTDNWTIRSGPTSSRGTGPARAKSGNSYIYLETSFSEANNQGDTAMLISPIVGRNTTSRHTLSFDYHMHGSDIGSLHVDILRGNDQGLHAQDILIIEGEQQSDQNDEWKTARVNLGPIVEDIRGGFLVPSFHVRLRAVADGGFRGDIAIDNITITDNDGRR